MKQIKLILVAMGMLAVSGSYAQSKTTTSASTSATTPATAPWAEMAAFHKLMAATFHPSEEGNFKPLRDKASDLYKAGQTWKASKIPADYKPKETMETLETLVKQLADIVERVKANASDKELGAMISQAHDTFHKIIGECKKADEPAH